MDLNGYDIDGVLSRGYEPVAPYVVISGRTWGEVTHLTLDPPPLAIAPRGVGVVGDRKDAALWKIKMITQWGVTTFYDDDPFQVALIKDACGSVCRVVLVTI